MVIRKKLMAIATLWASSVWKGENEGSLDLSFSCPGHSIAHRDELSL